MFFQNNILNLLPSIPYLFSLKSLIIDKTCSAIVLIENVESTWTVDIDLPSPNSIFAQKNEKEIRKLSLKICDIASS